MRRLLLLLVAVMLCTAALRAQSCVTIQEGQLTYSSGHYLAGQPLKVGYDAYGYNYQAHMFNGSYFNAYAGGAKLPAYNGDDASYLAANPGATSHLAWSYRSVTLNMKWNDAWLSNKDCDGDGKLDRHNGFPTYKGSSAWETNHQSDPDADGVHWSYFTKIVAAPATATETAGVWYDPSGTEIGPDIWGEFAVIQEVYNDPAAAAHGLQYKGAVNAGLGYY